MTEKARADIQKLVNTSKHAFISAIDSDGFPTTKAMFAMQHDADLRKFYFSTNVSALSTAQFEENPKACVYFCNKLRYEGLLFIGTMEVMRDRHHREKLWRRGDKKYYPQGIDDPDYCVLAFTPVHGRYYNGELFRDTFTMDEL